ncbi:MAG TPA: hypothetical protein VFK81_20880 [Terriglobales bacterium]|nr:hypothetical protein [Terriglobales bacterium]
MSYAICDLDSVDLGKTYIQHNHVWLEFPRFLNCFHPVNGFANDMQLLVCTQDGADHSSPLLEIIYHENAD